MLEDPASCGTHAAAVVAPIRDWAPIDVVCLNPHQRASKPAPAVHMRTSGGERRAGPAQIRAQLKRFRGGRLSVKAMRQVLVRNGYKLVRKETRPEGDEHLEWRGS